MLEKEQEKSKQLMKIFERKLKRMGIQKKLIEQFQQNETISLNITKE